jgi:hypothetical protein
MTFPYDEDFRDEDSGVFNEESPTAVGGRRRRREERERLARDPDYRMGKMIAEIIRLRREVDAMKHYTPPPPPRPSLKPQVATAGVSAGAATVVIAIFEFLKVIGVLK